MDAIERRIDRLLEAMDGPTDLEAWAEAHGTPLDLDEYREGDGTGRDDLPDDLEMPGYAALDTEGREVSIGPVDSWIRVAATNNGPCGNNFAARVWDVDTDELPEVDEEEGDE